LRTASGYEGGKTGVMEADAITLGASIMIAILVVSMESMLARNEVWMKS
jgi:hypothetical protein